MKELDECPNRDKHTPSPEGYVAWHTWAEKLAKTHRQSRCSGCGRWAIWTRVSGEGRDD